MRIDEFPTHEINGVHYRVGHALPYGVTMTDGGVNFSINSSTATYCELVLFHTGDKEPFVRIPLEENFRVGNNFAVLVCDLDVEDVEYGFCMDGPHVPEKGLVFDRNRILLDPYAKLVAGGEVWGEHRYARDEFPHRGKVLMTDFEWEGDKPLETPIEDLVIYEMHVRGFTKDKSSGVKHPGTYAGIVEKIPYMKELGINCIELLPIFEFDELEYSELPGDMSKRLNYWGYSTIDFFAPKAGYAALGPKGMAADELKSMIKKLHQNGIEVILDVVFNHTGENFDTISYKGIDNPTYYLLSEDGQDCNYSGCGNTFNCNNPVTRNHILDCLRYWVSDYHIDGFRFDEAPILSRDTNGQPMQNPPLLEALALDPILSRTKLIAEAWDAAGLYQVGSFPAPGRWAEWNGKFRDCVRHFVKSEVYDGNELIYRLSGSPDIYPERTARSNVNFVTCHDGFTLNDNFSYNNKHNDANGENNRDGIDNNVSWNCGIEGETDEAEVNALRARIVKNAFGLLMISRGTPMFVAGDEFRNTQFGNNNAYCQDNEISYLNWDRIDQYQDNYDFFKRMIALRKNHPILRKPTFDENDRSMDYPEVSFHGTSAWNFDRHAAALTFAVLYAEAKENFDVDEDTFIYVSINSYWEQQTMELPILPEGFVYRIYSSSDLNLKKNAMVSGNICVGPRTFTVLTAVKEG